MKFEVAWQHRADLNFPEKTSFCCCQLHNSGKKSLDKIKKGIKNNWQN